MELINTTNSIGIILGTATDTTTGSMFLTLLILLIVILAIAVMLQIQLEFTAILIFPLMLGYMAYYSSFIAIGGIMIIYFTVLITKNFLFR